MLFGNANCMYALAKLFPCILCCCFERKISLLRNLVCKLLLVVTKLHMFIFDQKRLETGTMIAGKETQAQHLTQLEDKLHKRAL